LSNKSTSNRQVLKAPKFEVKQWVDANGRKKPVVALSDFNGKFKVLFCFQSWCPGCHSRGLPALQKMVEALKENDKVAFLAIQTVFEGYSANTYEKMVETQKQYDLKIPFGHDAGNDDKSISNIMKNYRTGGTPWFIFIDMNDNIVFADFHLNENAAIAFLKSV
jgi:thiol-disulfide isomerase/thioredoxin